MAKKSWEETRTECIADGKVDLPGDQLAGLSEKQADFYLSLRGQYRQSLRAVSQLTEDRIKYAFAASIDAVMVGHLAKAAMSAGSLLAAFDAVAPRDVLQMKIDGVGAFIMARMAGLAPGREKE
jgi:hypothetical protein